MVVRATCEVCQIQKDVSCFSKKRIRARIFYCLKCDVLSSPKEERDVDEGDNLIIIKKKKRCLKCDEFFETEIKRVCTKCAEKNLDEDTDYYGY